MENRDFVIESILSIEDFDNVDKSLMEKINSDGKYRRIFDEYKEMSGLTRECVPEAVKDGITLKAAVIDRVKSGDTAPRFLNIGTRTRFPFATAASVAVILAAVLFSTVVTRINDRKSAENMNFAPAMEDNGAVYNYSLAGSENVSDESGGAYFQKAVAEEEQVQKKFQLKAAPVEYKKSKEAETENSAKDDKERVQVNSIYDESSKAFDGYAYSDEELSDSSALQTTLVAGQSINDAIYYKSEATDEVYFDAESEQVREECESVTVSSEVALRLDYAEGFSVPDEKKIYPEDIYKYGEENFIAWFDGICNNADFGELYGIDEFIEYCENIEN